MPPKPEPSLYPREIAPLSHRIWQRQNLDESGILQAQFTQWLENVTSSEAIFKQYVYENPNLQDTDLRQHRSFLYALLHDGETLAYQYLDLGTRTGKSEEFKAHVTIIDQNLKELFKTLIAWHGPLSAQSDIPESFKQAVQEVAQGKILDFKEP